ncbi:MAG: hypothetical protein FIB08_16305 [Candidatus Methanoperedens sp.]|nr:hypothetical protein [Candidatus Methanoperedens sp.]
MDIIFCRNVLMYFTQGNARRAIQRLYDSLDVGRLIVGSVESSYILFSQSAATNLPGTPIYKKDSCRSQRNIC